MKNIRLIGIPMDLGQSCRGVNMGPDAIRYAGLKEALEALGYGVEDLGNIHIPVRATLSKDALVAEISKAAEACYRLAAKAVDEGTLPLFLGGDHGIAIGSIGGVTESQRCGVIWVDAHADFNTPETSPSGNTHGMALSILLGQGYPRLVNCGRPGAKIGPEDVVMIGIRELDPEERIRLSESGITVFTMRDIDEKGMGQIAHEALCALSHHNRLHVSMDMDALSPENAPGVGTPVPGGLTYREAHLLMEIIADSGRLSSMDIVEINPIMDTRNTTATMAVHLAVSLFGKQIF